MSQSKNKSQEEAAGPNSGCPSGVAPQQNEPGKKVTLGMLNTNDSSPQDQAQKLMSIFQPTFPTFEPGNSTKNEQPSLTPPPPFPHGLQPHSKTTDLLNAIVAAKSQLALARENVPGSHNITTAPPAHALPTYRPCLRSPHCPPVQLLSTVEQFELLCVACKNNNLSLRCAPAPPVLIKNQESIGAQGAPSGTNDENRANSPKDQQKAPASSVHKTPFFPVTQPLDMRGLYAPQNLLQGPGISDVPQNFAGHILKPGQKGVLPDPKSTKAAALSDPIATAIDSNQARLSRDLAKEPNVMSKTDTAPLQNQSAADSVGALAQKVSSGEIGVDMNQVVKNLNAYLLMQEQAQAAYALNAQRSMGLAPAAMPQLAARLFPYYASGLSVSGPPHNLPLYNPVTLQENPVPSFSSGNLKIEKDPKLSANQPPQNLSDQQQGKHLSVHAPTMQPPFEMSQHSSAKSRAHDLMNKIAECKKIAVRSTQAMFNQRIESKTFEGIPRNWHQTIKVRHPETLRVKLYFKCRHKGCGSIFKKSCNLRDHFRKHTGQRPFTCPKCQKTFTQSGNLGRHLKNVHAVPRENISFYKRQSKIAGEAKGMSLISEREEKQWQKSCSLEQQQFAESDDGGSLVLMTVQQFEQRYPDIAESCFENSHDLMPAAQPHNPKPAAPQKQARRRDPSLSCAEESNYFSEEDVVDSSSSFRV